MEFSGYAAPPSERKLRFTDTTTVAVVAGRARMSPHTVDAWLCRLDETYPGLWRDPLAHYPSRREIAAALRERGLDELAAWRFVEALALARWLYLATREDM